MEMTTTTMQMNLNKKLYRDATRDHLFKLMNTIPTSWWKAQWEAAHVGLRHVDLLGRDCVYVMDHFRVSVQRVFSPKSTLTCSRAWLSAFRTQFFSRGFLDWMEWVPQYCDYLGGLDLGQPPVPLRLQDNSTLWHVHCRTFVMKRMNWDSWAFARGLSLPDWKRRGSAPIRKGSRRIYFNPFVFGKLWLDVQALVPQLPRFGSLLALWVLLEYEAFQIDRKLRLRPCLFPIEINDKRAYIEGMRVVHARTNALVAATPALQSLKHARITWNPKRSIHPHLLPFALNKTSISPEEAAKRDRLAWEEFTKR